MTTMETLRSNKQPIREQINKLKNVYVKPLSLQDESGLLTLEAHQAIKDQSDREMVAAVAMDDHALAVLNALNHGTSIDWTDLKKQIKLPWSQIVKGIALVTSAGLCDADSHQLIISPKGDRIASQWTRSRILPK